MERIADLSNYQVFDKLGFAVVYEVGEDAWAVTFNVFETIGIGDEGCVFRKPGPSGGSNTTDVREAEMAIWGRIKWDGCSDFDFHEDDTCRHFCGREDLIAFAQLLVELWGIAESVLPNLRD